MNTDRYVSELRPTWRNIKEIPPPKNTKVLFKSNLGPAVIGIWYNESQWHWWSPLPSHTPEQKIAIKNAIK